MRNIRILEIGKDEVMSWRYVKIESGLVDRRYRFNSAAIFYTYRYRFFGSGLFLTPTLMYYYNHDSPILLPGKKSNPTPETINQVLESAIVALSDLFRRGQERMMGVVLLVVGIVAIMVFYLVFVGGV